MTILRNQHTLSTIYTFVSNEIAFPILLTWMNLIFLFSHEYESYQEFRNLSSKFKLSWEFVNKHRNL